MGTGLGTWVWGPWVEDSGLGSAGWGCWFGDDVLGWWVGDSGLGTLVWGQWFRVVVLGMVFWGHRFGNGFGDNVLGMMVWGLCFGVVVFGALLLGPAVWGQCLGVGGLGLAVWEQWHSPCVPPEAPLAWAPPIPTHSKPPAPDGPHPKATSSSGVTRRTPQYPHPGEPKSPPQHPQSLFIGDEALLVPPQGDDGGNPRNGHRGDHHRDPLMRPGPQNPKGDGVGGSRFDPAFISLQKGNRRRTHTLA